jgi:hypothetical protein
MESNYHYDYSRISNSMLSVLKTSPQEFDQRFISRTLEAPGPTPAMRIGTLIHCLALEPEHFYDRYIIKPSGMDRRTKEGKEAYSDLVASGKEIIEPDEYKLAFDCVQALNRHDQISSVLGKAIIGYGLIEERVDFEFNGVPMRSKQDVILTSINLIIDVKTTQAANPIDFAKSVANYGYARQAALYQHAAEQRFGSKFRFLFAVVSKQAPHEVACYELDDDAQQQGLEEAIQLTNEYKYRLESNDWLPSWSKGVVVISLPKWHRSNLYNLEEVA